MTLFGYSLEQIFLVVLIFAGLATVLVMFFGDAVEGIGEGLPIFNPSVILSFITLMSAAGFILEKLAWFSSVWNIIAACIIGAILSSIFYLFVLIPLINEMNHRYELCKKCDVKNIALIANTGETRISLLHNLMKINIKKLNDLMKDLVEEGWLESPITKQSGYRLIMNEEKLAKWRS
ncbi:hypothetical protein [Lysinibacillus capsici]|uniref:hypothetical protein n=1 Tax=Lysinibacillus capsici TaxID=2115968 RepID=UPI0036972B45